MSSSRRRWTVLAVAPLVALVVAGIGLRLLHHEPRLLDRASLDLRDGVLFAHGETKPFDGLLVESYPRGAKKVEIAIRDGRADGLSRGWFENGQIEIEEHFVKGVSEGARIRWHANGVHRSVARISQGQFVGLYEEWYDNGRKAMEITFRNGKPDGRTRAWSESAAEKPSVHYHDGVATVTVPVQRRP